MLPSWPLFLVFTFASLSGHFNAFRQKFPRKNTISSIRMAINENKLHVMVNGLPGLMALEAAKVCIDRGHSLLPIGFTGSSGKMSEIMVQGGKDAVNVKLIPGPGLSDTAAQTLKELKEKHPDVIIIDYTHPSAAITNLQSYVENDCDFVMGTTGGDQEQMLQLLERGSNIAVIAPNMAKQIVALQAAILEMSNRFPKAFQQYTLTAIVGHLSKLTGSDFSFESIVKIRDTESQLKFGVPAYSLSGHAFHTYHLRSSDGSVAFELQHNVCGRRVYAEGTVDAVEFVAEQRRAMNAAESTFRGKRLFSMIDVLESGSMI